MYLCNHCPECDSSDLYTRRRKRSGKHYHCTRCGFDFDKPIMKAPMKKNHWQAIQFKEHTV